MWVRKFPRSVWSSLSQESVSSLSRSVTGSIRRVRGRFLVDQARLALVLAALISTAGWPRFDRRVGVFGSGGAFLGDSESFLGDDGAIS